MKYPYQFLPVHMKQFWTTNFGAVSMVYKITLGSITLEQMYLAGFVSRILLSAILRSKWLVSLRLEVAAEMWDPMEWSDSLLPRVTLEWLRIPSLLPIVTNVWLSILSLLPRVMLVWLLILSLLLRVMLVRSCCVDIVPERKLWRCDAKVKDWAINFGVVLSRGGRR
jgi:hypothetical protein